MDAAGSAVRIQILPRVLPCHGESDKLREAQSLIAACTGRYSGRPLEATAPYPSRKFAYHHEDDFSPFLTIHIDYETARSYRKAMGYYLRQNQWEDIAVDIYL